MFVMKHIFKKFDSDYVLNDINVEVSAGEMIGIIGASGSGKSTILNIIGLLDNKFEGELLFDGIAMKNLSEAKRYKYIRENINYLFQNYALVDDESVQENLMYALYYSKLPKPEQINIINKVLNDLGIEELLAKKIYKLSGGEQQRVALARLMIKPGNLILADEPTGNLDKSNKELVLSILKSLNRQGKTVVIVTHDEYIANNCDRIFKL